MEGWGAHMDMNLISGKWTEEQSRFHINQLELIAVRLALHQWEKTLKNSVVLVVTDNSTVVAHINKQGGAVSRTMCLEVTHLLDFDSQEEYSLNFPTHTRQAECSCRFVLQRWTDTTNRMVYH